MFQRSAVACEPIAWALGYAEVMRQGVTIMRESKIQADIREALGLEIDLVLWRNNTGLARETARDGSERFIKYGLGVGSADLVGILARQIDKQRVGTFFALEIKQPGENPRIEQRQWGDMVRFFGGFYAAVHSVEEARAALSRARRGETE